jgi:hypothetical protein
MVMIVGLFFGQLIIKTYLIFILLTVSPNENEHIDSPLSNNSVLDNNRCGQIGCGTK